MHGECMGSAPGECTWGVHGECMGSAWGVQAHRPISPTVAQEAADVAERLLLPVPLCEETGQVLPPPAGAYDGQYHNGRQHGIGVYRWANGSVYEGDWVAGHMEGRGKLRYSDGSSYEGQFVDSVREGHGHFKREGNVYEGQWCTDLMDGLGQWRWADGDVQIDRYVEGYRVGEGVRWSADGHSAWSLTDGEIVQAISLHQAAGIASALGMPVPIGTDDVDERASRRSRRSTSPSLRDSHGWSSVRRTLSTISARNTASTDGASPSEQSPLGTRKLQRSRGSRGNESCSWSSSLREPSDASAACPAAASVQFV